MSKTLYTSPIVEYNAGEWDQYPKCIVNKLGMVRQRAAHYVDQNYEWVHGTVTALLEKYGMDML